MIAMVMVIAVLIFSILASGIVALAQAQSVTNMSDSMGLRIWDVNSSTTDDRNIYAIMGKVFNNDTVPFNGVRVSATLYDKDDQILVERSAYSSPSGVQPGMNATFEINVFGTVIEGGINAIANFTMQVTGDRQELLFQ
jgi:hypothetical protein